MKLQPVIIWIFGFLALLFFFFSLRSKENELYYAIIALVFWGIAFLINKFKPGEKKEKT